MSLSGAVDQHLNSNTLLLVVANDDPVKDHYSLQSFLTKWLRSDLFQDMLLEADKLRGWHNLRPARIGHFYGYVFLQALSPVSFVAHLWWMLQEGPSPYGPFLTRQQATQILYDFGNELFGSQGWESFSFMPNQLPALKSTIEQHYQFYAMSPQQLTSRIPNYFYNLGADSVTVIAHEEIIYLLLTNGSD